MKAQKPEFNWKLYEFSREELGLSMLARVWSQDEFPNQTADQDYRRSVDCPKPDDEVRI